MYRIDLHIKLASYIATIIFHNNFLPSVIIPACVCNNKCKELLPWKLFVVPVAIDSKALWLGLELRWEKVGSVQCRVGRV